MKRALTILFLVSFVLAGAQGFLIAPKWSGFKAGTFSKVAQSSTFIINNEAEFQTYWRNQIGDRSMPSTKDVKWGQELLVAVHLGQRPTAGYSVLVRKLERRTSNTTTVCYDERKPAPNSSAGSVTTSPYEIIRVERAAGNFEFERSEGRQSGGVVTSDFLSWRVYEEGRTCGVTREGTYVIRNQDEFEVYWRSLNAEDVAPRDVDWSKENLIAIHLGSKATGGYEILPREVVPLNDGRLYCSFLERLPSRDQHVSKTKTSPYCILRVAKFLGAVLFDHRTWDNTGTG